MQTGNDDGIDGAKSERATEVISALMDGISQEEHRFIVLRYGEQLEPIEIAGVLRCTEEHVIQTLENVEARLRELLKPAMVETS